MAVVLRPVIIRMTLNLIMSEAITLIRYIMLANLSSIMLAI